MYYINEYKNITYYSDICGVLNIKGCSLVYAQQYISTRDVAILFIARQNTFLYSVYCINTIYTAVPFAYMYIVYR